MAINPVQLVGLARQTPDFVGSFLQGKQFKQDQDYRNELLDMKKQEMSAAQAQAQQVDAQRREQAEINFFGRAGDMLGQLDEEDRPAAFEQIRQMAIKNNLDIDGMPEAYTPEILPMIQQQAKLKGYAGPGRETVALKPGDTLVDKQTGQAITSIDPNKDPEKVQPIIKDLRSRYDKFNSDFRDVDAAYRKVSTAPEDAAGDMSMIFGFMKLLDPGSTVREGEFATAESAAGVPTRILNAYNRALTGKRLDPAQRKEFEGAAQAAFTAQQSSADEQLANLLSQADADGVSRERVVGSKALREFEKRAADRLIQQRKTQKNPTEMTDEELLNAF